MRREAFRDQGGVTLVEILVVTTVMTLLAAITLPVYQIIQQRERERRLEEILDNVRASLYGNQEARVFHSFTEGYQIHVVRQIHSKVAAAAIPYTLMAGASGGLLLPLNPCQVENAVGTKVKIATSSTPGDEVEITINRRFIRRIPPHPFVGWFPNAHWEFETATDASALPWETKRYASGSWPVGTATGVKNIWSKGAGILLDGRNSDNL